ILRLRLRDISPLFFYYPTRPPAISTLSLHDALPIFRHAGHHRFAPPSDRRMTSRCRPTIPLAARRSKSRRRKSRRSEPNEVLHAVRRKACGKKEVPISTQYRNANEERRRRPFGCQPSTGIRLHGHLLLSCIADCFGELEHGGGVERGAVVASDRFEVREPREVPRRFARRRQLDDGALALR